MPAIYHITHCENIANIAAGGLWSDIECQARQVGGRAIGYGHIKQRRAEYPVPLPPNGTVGNYVPFYFAPRSPMLYTIHCRNTEYQGGQEPVVHLVASTDAVTQYRPALQWLFTDGHAVIDLSTYYNNIADLNQIDWAIMRAWYWADTRADGDRLGRRQAEFLVHGFFPYDLVEEIGVINQATADQVRKLVSGAAHSPKIVIHRDWYY